MGSYIFLFLVSKLVSLQQAFGVEIESDAVPPVWQFWLMMAHPVTSKVVGIFTLMDDNFRLGDHEIQPDRLIALFCWVIIAAAGIRFQCKAATAPTAAEVTTLEKPLLDNTPKGKDKEVP